MRPELAGDWHEGIASVRRVTMRHLIIETTFATGLRNVQGLAFHPRTRELFAVDHGPTGMPQEHGWRGNDELNVLRDGAWYGWGASPIRDDGDTTTVPPPTPPIAVWPIAIAPAGLAFAPPAWGDDVLLVTGLRSGALHRLQLARDTSRQGWRVLDEQRLLEGYGRLRALAVDSTGAVWVGTSNADGRGVRRAEGDLLLRVRLAR